MSPRVRTSLPVVAVAALLWAEPAAAAHPVYLSLKANGTSIEGEPSKLSIGGDDTSKTLECFLFRTGLRSRPNGQVRGGAVTCRKRIDKGSPLLIDAMIKNQVIEMGARFYRNNPGDGSTERHYSITGTQGRVVSVKQFVPDTLNPATSSQPELEEITIEFGELVFTHTTGGSTAVWNRPTP